MSNKKNSLKFLFYYVINVILLKLIKIFLRHYESDKWYSKEHIVVKNGIDVVILTVVFKVRNNVYDKDSRYCCYKIQSRYEKLYTPTINPKHVFLRVCLAKIIFANLSYYSAYFYYYLSYCTFWYYSWVSLYYFS